MADESLIPEFSKKKSKIEDFMEYIPDWIPGVSALREQKKRIQGTSKAKKKKDNPFGEYE